MHRRIALILVFVFFGLLFIHSIDSINQDIGRHLKSGEIIWQSRSVYKINLFSFTEPEHFFVNHHWLGEVIFYLGEKAVGLEGLIVAKAIILILVLLILFLSTNKISGIGSFLAAILFAAPVFLTRTDVRPEIFSYFYLSIFLFACFRAKYERTKKWLYILPFIQILWTNSHIYFALGPMILFLFWIDRKINLKSEILNPKQYQNQKVLKFRILNLFRDLGLEFKIFVLTLLATLVNPNFLNGALAPFTILNNYGYSVLENQNIFFLKNYGLQLRDIVFFQLSLAILIITALLAIKRSGIKKLSFELMLAIIFSVLAIKMIRNFGLYGLAFIPIVSIFLSYFQWHYEQHNVSFIRRWGYWGIIGILIWLIFNVPNDNVYNWLADNQRFGLIVPQGAAKAVEFVKKNNIKGPVFNNFDIGSFLIWKLYPAPSCSADRHSEKGRAWCGISPDFRVFVDGRPEAYSVDFFEKIYKPMQEDPALWKKYSDLYKINYVFFDYHDITPWAQSFLAQISKHPDWPLVYLDNSVAIFLKRVPENKDLISKFETKIVP